ncbi:ABC transporter permease [Synechocystis sp. PCC 7509]|uniref:ABC transporter permease n=1 Tax=Synechocystis sp. PCC 7509 TaxID=927677 RepID=UPI0002AC88AC|nr:ABC transporter permease [Synechocystis sp. PCC 7509]
MFEHIGITLGLEKTLFWLAQVPVTEGVQTPEDAALLFSGPKFFVALIAGVVLAFAVQLLLTNVGVAFLLGRSSDEGESDRTDEEATSFGGTIRKIGTALGLGTLISVSISLAIACFLAVKLSLIASSGLGAIVGLVIWAAYFLLLVWIGSSSVGSLIGSLINTATSGVQALMGTAAAALGAKAVNNQVVATAEAAAGAIRRELGSAVDPMSIRENVEDYLQMLRPPELDLSKIKGEFEKLLSDPQLKAVAGSSDLRNIDRQKFVELVSSRTDLSKKDMNRIVDQLESVWKQVVDRQEPQTDRMGEMVEYLKSVAPGQTKTDELDAKIDKLMAEMRQTKDTSQKAAQENTPGIMQTGINTLIGLVMGRTDLSDFDVEKIIGSLTSAKDKVTEQVDKVATQTGVKTPSLPYSTIRADVENYLLNTYSWQMSQDKIAQEFHDVLYDPAADPGAVRRQLEQLSRNDFVQLLQQRGILTQTQIASIADRLESIRTEVLMMARAQEEKEAAQDLQRAVESYLLVTSKSELTTEGVERTFKPLLQDAEASHETLSIRLAGLDRESMRQVLLQRNDVSEAEAEEIVGLLESQRDRVLFESQNIADQAKAQAESLWLNLESYLRNTGKDELNPNAIASELKTLLNDPSAGMSAIASRVSRFDRDTLVQLLNQRQDLNEEQINQTIDQVESTWGSLRHAPQNVAALAKDQYDSVTTTLSDYLRNTGKDELNPEGIARDFSRLFENPQEGALALRRRLSQVDRDTLVQLLSQRRDLSEEQVNQVIDGVQGSIRNIVKSPRRLAARTQQRVQTFQSNVEDYLRNTGKDELNPEAIKRDLQLLIHDPRAGVESFSDRLAHFDRDTVVTLLQARGDMSEEEAARIVDQVLAVREQFVEQVRAVQRRIQDTLDGVFGQIRNYLNALDRPELNYDGIKRDVRQLFDDPQAGFDSIRDRLGSFNRDTLVAVMSSREDISEADANRIIDQIEGARNSVLQRAERIQQEAQRRLEDVKRQAQKQAEETRKAAATAAQWLAGTAIVSAICSAIAGALAVAG